MWDPVCSLGQGSWGNRFQEKEGRHLRGSLGIPGVLAVVMVYPRHFLLQVKKSDSKTFGIQSTPPNKTKQKQKWKKNKQLRTFNILLSPFLQKEKS